MLLGVVSGEGEGGAVTDVMMLFYRCAVFVWMGRDEHNGNGQLTSRDVI